MYVFSGSLSAMATFFEDKNILEMVYGAQSNIRYKDHKPDDAFPAESEGIRESTYLRHILLHWLQK